MKTNSLLAVAIISISIIALSLIALAGSCGRPARTNVRILCADSLMVPLNDVEKAFEKARPDVDILTEGHGSIQAIREVTELNGEADLVAVADHSLIPMLMYTTKMPDSADVYADWYLKFAANTMGIAYKSSSKYSGEINENNWYELLSRPDIKLGFADARLDSCGYRTLMVLYLAGLYYHDESILQRVIGPFKPSLEITSDVDAAVIKIPEILRPDSDKVVLRGSSMRLIALMESGDIDYFFEYRSVAEQHGFQFLELPAAINLGVADQSPYYRQVRCKIDFQRFATVQPEFTGEPVIYGLTIPRNAPRPDIAVAYIEFMFGEEGQKIFASAHHPLISPVADNPGNLPSAVKLWLGEFK